MAEPQSSSSLRRHSSTWDAAHWEQALGSYARATGLALSVYDLQGERRLGPFIHQPLAQMLSAVGAFQEGGAATAFERKLVEQCLSGRCDAAEDYEGALRVCSKPAIVSGEMVGVFTFGWVFSRFPDPLLSDRIAREVGLPSNRFWLASRQHLPVSSDKLAVYDSLLSTLTRAILQQLSFQAELLNADRMKDEFLSTLSHELRTPMTSVQLRLQSLIRMLPAEDPRVNQTLQAIQRGLSTQGRLINELLDTSRILTGKMVLERKRINLSQVIRAAAETVLPIAQAKGVQLQANVTEATRDLYADPERLQQLVWNLLVNGVKFTPPEGTVSVSLVETPSSFEIIVRDTGEGIDAPYLRSVFDRFSQGHQRTGSQKGLGLGLSLVRYIAELHGGSAHAESEGRGRGATFRVQLPARSQEH